MVRSRFGAVSGFDAATGERSREHVPPGRSVVCHATADTVRSVLVLIHDGDGASSPAEGTSCTTAVGIDMKDGRELWQAPISRPEPPRFQDSSVSAGGGVAVLLQKDELRAVDVRTGRPRWKAALPKDRVPGRTAAGERQIAALLACGGDDNPWDEKVAEDAEPHTAAFDPATGALKWSTPLGGPTGHRLQRLRGLRVGSGRIREAHAMTGSGRQRDAMTTTLDTWARAPARGTSRA
ncbi:PQQ-binding-like beta-propeller repeat protein [Streptomyces sp. NK15101]|uniref:outer membrane protein assembly factor BamB family protein n=1 Tax=Streptomyces sp. NK15101 TaxID=2873261 RepID=UPI0035A991AD